MSGKESKKSSLRRPKKSSARVRGTLEIVSAISGASSRTATSPLSSDINEPLPAVDLQRIERAPRVRLSEGDVPHNPKGLTQLAANGSWTAFCHLSQQLAVKGDAKPHQILQYKLCHVLGLLRLREYSTALEYVNSLGNFGDRYNCFEHYAKIYPNLTGSMMPFTLRIVKASLPYFTKTDKSLTQLFELIEWIKEKYLASRTHNTDDATVATEAKEQFPFSDSEKVTLAALEEIDDSARAAMLTGQPMTDADTPPLRWRIRLRRVRFLIASILAFDQRPRLAATILERERRNRFMFVSLKPQKTEETVNQINAKQTEDDDMPLLSSLGRLYLSYGDLKAADSVFHSVEMIAERHPKSRWRQVSVLMNRGLVAMATEKYTDAVDCFQAVLDADPQNLAAANNRSVCLLYACALPNAIVSLEGALTDGQLDPTIIGNLCTLYDLASDRSAEKKKQLLALVSKYAPDDFVTDDLAPKLSAASGSSPAASGDGSSPTTARSNSNRKSISSANAASVDQKKRSNRGKTTKV